MVNETIKYYNQNAQSYFINTVSADMKSLYQPFLKHLPPGGKILDAGCGSGRDSLYFKENGYEVMAIDGSEAMVKLCSQLIGQDAILMDFEHLKLAAEYDGIWACASLLHVNRNTLVPVLTRFTNALNQGGVFYMSFKYGNGEFYTGGRYFNCMDEKLFDKVAAKIPGLRIKKIFRTKDVRAEHKEEYWLNIYLVKK